MSGNNFRTADHLFPGGMRSSRSQNRYLSTPSRQAALPKSGVLSFNLKERGYGYYTLRDINRLWLADNPYPHTAQIITLSMLML